MRQAGFQTTTTKKQHVREFRRCLQTKGSFLVKSEDPPTGPVVSPHCEVHDSKTRQKEEKCDLVVGDDEEKQASKKVCDGRDN